MDLEHTSRCFVHLANSSAWKAITGQAPPTKAPTAADYTRGGMPWFDYYSETPALPGSKALAGVKSVLEMNKEKRDSAEVENESCTPDKVVPLAKKGLLGKIRDGKW